MYNQFWSVNLNPRNYYTSKRQNEESKIIVNKDLNVLTEMGIVLLLQRMTHDSKIRYRVFYQEGFL